MPPTSATGARRCCSARRSASARGCWSTSAITPRGSTSSRSSRILAGEGRLGGFHFNNRKYADDDLIVGSVNPFELFLIFAELRAGGRALPRLTIDQSHNIEAKVEAMVLSVVNLQESYAKSLLIDRAALRGPSATGDVLGGHELLLDAFNTDVRPLCAKVREELGAAADPIARPARLRLRRRGWPPSAQRPNQHGGLGHDEHRRPHRRTVPMSGPRTPPGPHHALEQVAARLAPAGRQPRAGQLRRRQHSAKGTATDHVGREVAAMWVKGSGSDLATMSATDFTPLRLDEIAAAARARRDVRRGHGRPPGALPARPRRRRAPRSRRCCTPSSRPRTCTTPTRTPSTRWPAPPTARS